MLSIYILNKKIWKIYKTIIIILLPSTLLPLLKRCLTSVAIAVKDSSTFKLIFADVSEYLILYSAASASASSTLTAFKLLKIYEKIINKIINV